MENYFASFSWKRVRNKMNKGTEIRGRRPLEAAATITLGFLKKT
jgi:hypothetical protein